MSTPAEDDPWPLAEADRDFESVPGSEVTVFPLCDPSGVVVRCNPSSGGIAGTQPPANGLHPSGMLPLAFNAKSNALVSDVADVADVARRIRIVSDADWPAEGTIKVGLRPGGLA